MDSDKNPWLKDYNEFLEMDSSQSQVPLSLYEKIKARIFPNPWMVFSKVFGIHILVGFLSLGICNQFGLNPFNTEQSLTDWFMKIGGHNFCMIACGVFFMATTYLLSNFVLSLEELESVKRYEWLQTSILILISLSSFYFFGGEIVGLFALLWIVGAALGSRLSIETSYRFRRSWT